MNHKSSECETFKSEFKVSYVRRIKAFKLYNSISSKKSLISNKDAKTKTNYICSQCFLSHKVCFKIRELTNAYHSIKKCTIFDEVFSFYYIFYAYKQALISAQYYLKYYQEHEVENYENFLSNNITMFNILGSQALILLNEFIDSAIE